MAKRESDMCRCGHQRVAHEHFRAGTDCSLCAPGDCSSFRNAAGFVARAKSVLERRA